jgi:hypothetical protein
LSKEEALRRAIEESELVELGNWEGLGARLAASTSSSGAGCPRGVDGALAVSLGPAATHRPQRGR